MFAQRPRITSSRKRCIRVSNNNRKMCSVASVVVCYLYSLTRAVVMLSHFEFRSPILAFEQRVVVASQENVAPSTLLSSRLLAELATFQRRLKVF